MLGHDEKDPDFSKVIVTSNLSAIVDGLVDAAQYLVTISAFVSDFKVSKNQHGEVLTRIT